MSDGYIYGANHIPVAHADVVVVVVFRYVVIWKKIDSKYMMYIDIFNSVIPQQ